jgi:hypothetical protein
MGEIAKLETSIAKAIAAEDWPLVDSLRSELIPHLIRRMEVEKAAQKGASDEREHD